MRRQTGITDAEQLETSGTGGSTVNVRIINGFNLPPYDSFQIVDTSTTEDTVEYYVGGLGGTLVATVLITYTSTAKTSVQSAVETII
jgi:hypothetical protein